MKILFLTMINIKTIYEKGIYQDLLREFVKNGHQVYVVSPTERRNKEKTKVFFEGGEATILRVRTLNLQKTNIIEKGFATISIEGKFLKAIKKYFKDVQFDLVLYSTPPITFAKVVRYIKNRDRAKTYLLLKDIFPQNAVDIGLLSNKGLQGFLYRFFRKKEKELYKISDKIGCMSQANCDYLLRNNPTIDTSRVEVCPNAIEYIETFLTEEEKKAIRQKYNIPLNKKVFVYGGNLGKPQGIPFIINCLKAQENNNDIFFLIVGNGTEYDKLELSCKNSSNVKLMSALPREDYDKMIHACDIGMIFLDYRFTIPNFPSRLLSYMQAGLPILACTDRNTDIGEIITQNNFGWWCESKQVEDFSGCIKQSLQDDLVAKGKRSKEYLRMNYTTELAFQVIQRSYNESTAN